MFETGPSEVQRCNIIHSFSREERGGDKGKQRISNGRKFVKNGDSIEAQFQ
jgi:hypothetical protein